MTNDIEEACEQQVTIPVDILPSNTNLDTNNLVEIDDDCIIEQIKTIAPKLFQVGNDANNVREAIQTNGEIWYKAIIPSGEKLAKVKDDSGLFRGFCQETNGKINGNVKLERNVLNNSTEIASNFTAVAMNVASIVVGQYYMKRIDEKLENISGEVKAISDFLENEYCSKMIVLTKQVKDLAHFQSEIIDDEECRCRKLNQLDDHETLCTQLLVQANLAIEGITKKQDQDFDTYEENIEKVKKWCQYQRILMEILCKITELKYALKMGKVSRERCSAIVSGYKEQILATQAHISEWHNQMILKLSIDLNNCRRPGSKYRKLIYSTNLFAPLLRKNTAVKNFIELKAIKKETVDLIRAQKNQSNVLFVQDNTELYDKDVQLIAKGGRIYYLPEKL